MNQITALHGLPGCGKDTMADLLVSREGYTKVAFADGLYIQVAHHFGTTVDYLKDRKNKLYATDLLSLYNCTHPGYRRFMAARSFDLYEPRTSRFHLDNYGTDYMREVDSLHWVKIALKSISSTKGPVVVSDLRSYRDMREYDALRRLAAEQSRELRIVLLERKGCECDGHEAHHPLPRFLVDEVVEVAEGDIEATYASLLAQVGWFTERG